MIEIMNKIDAKVEYFDDRGTFLGGERYVVTFDNGFGASIICNNGSYGGRSGLWELCIIHKSTGNEDYEHCYKTSITNDVIGWLKPENISVLVMEIMALGKSDLCNHIGEDGSSSWEN